MAVFWNSFLELVETLLDYVKSSQSGNWEQHLHSMERMLNLFHAYDHATFAMHFTYCLETQKSVQEGHPLTYEVFHKGNFTVKQSQSKFNCLSPHQVIEQTVNKEQKGPGGIIRFSTTPGTVQRWEIASHVIVIISSKFKKDIGFDELNSVPKDLSTKRLWLTRSQSTHATRSSVPGSTLLKRAMLSLGFRQGVQHQRISRTIFLMQKISTLDS